MMVCAYGFMFVTDSYSRAGIYAGQRRFRIGRMRRPASYPERMAVESLCCGCRKGALAGGVSFRNQIH